MTVLRPSYFGEAKRPLGRPLAISQKDRLLHLLVLGRTGVGKSSLLSNLARQDISAGRGCAVIDPHGDLVTDLYASLSSEERARTVYVDPADPSCRFGYNPLRQVQEGQIALAASELMGIFEKQWPSAWGVRMEHVLRNSIYALLSRANSTLPDILRLYRDETFRDAVVAQVSNAAIRNFWQEEFEPLTTRQRAEIVAPIENKLGALLSDPVLMRTLAKPKVDLDLRATIDSGVALLVNLSRGRIGEDSASLLGSVMVSAIGAAAFSRANIPQSKRRPLYLYVDEFQTFTTRTFASMISELRKTGVGLTLATQHVGGVQADVRHAVLGNVGTIIAFRLGADDATALAREFGPRIGTLDLMNLPNREFYVKMMVDGAPAPVVSGRTSESLARRAHG